MNSAVCPECHCQIRTTIPKGGDGSIDVFVRHSTKGAVRRMCPGSRCEVQRPPSALEKIQSYDSSGKPGRLSAFTPLTTEELALAWEAYCARARCKLGVDADVTFSRAIRAAVEAVLAKRAKPLTPAELAGLGIQVEDGYALLDRCGEPRTPFSRDPFVKPPAGRRAVRARRITIWEKP